MSLISIIMPSLERTNDFLATNSPSLPMLRYLDIVLSDIYLVVMDRKKRLENGSLKLTDDQEAKFNKLQSFLVDLFTNFVGTLSYSPYDEVFAVFDKLMYLTSDVLSEPVLRKCIVTLVDKYTVKSKAHKNSMTAFMKMLMDSKS